MNLSISYSREDRQAADRIRGLCNELGVASFLDERNDWLN